MSYWLLLEDGNGTAGQIVTLKPPDGADDDEVGTITLDGGSILVGGDGDGLALGGHLLATDERGDEGNLVTKIELENVPVEVVVEKTPGELALESSSSPGKKKNTAKNPKTIGNSLTAADRKVCLWPTGSGTTCGKTFTKFDSLKRHLSEAHKGLRPFACTLCEKTYGRRDYLQRHLKSHNASYAVNLAGGNLQNATVANTAQLVKKVQLAASKNAAAREAALAGASSSATQPIIVQVSNTQGGSGGGTVQIIQGSPEPELSPSSSKGGKNLNTPNPLPFFSISGQLPTAKPMGSKVCRWVQNDGTVCGKAFSKLDSLRRHVNELHKGNRPYACNMCDKSYGRRDYLDRHIRTHEKKKAKLEAAAAGGAVDEDGNIDMGVLMAGDEVPPPPKVVKKKRKDIPPEEKKICLWILDDGTACGKTFTKFDSLKRHVSEAHKSIRPYGCTICGKNYGRRDYLLRHLRSHSEVDVSKININKVRNNPSNHPDNLASASGSATANTPGLPNISFSSMAPQPSEDDPYPSPIKITPAPAPSAASLKRKALEDKKTCKWALENGSICGRTFSKHDSLRRHIDELHKNIRPFVCELCNKSYGRKDYLDRHMKSHEETSEENDSKLPSLVDDGMDDDDAPMVGLDTADIEISGASTGRVVDSDEESDGGGGAGGDDAMIVVGEDGSLDALPLPGGSFKKPVVRGVMPAVGLPLTKTVRITDDHGMDIADDMETTTTTTVVVEGVEDDDDEDGVLASVVTVVSNDEDV